MTPSLHRLSKSELKRGATVGKTRAASLYPTDVPPLFITLPDHPAPAAT